MRKLASLLLVGVLGACATLGGGNRGLNPVGTFDFSTDVQGTPVSGTLVVTEASGGYGGTLSTNMTETVSISSVTVTEQTMTVTATLPDGSVSFSLAFTGDTFTGTWSYAGMTGTVQGRRRAS